MPAVLVHGVPEIPAVWDPVRAHLSRTDVITPHLPGFNSAVPAGFGATKDEYAAWLIGEVERIAAEDGPVDLVGHDWGAAFVGRLVSLRPELVRTWVVDAAGFGDPDFVWHEFAQALQTPGVGEELIEQELATPRAEYLAGHVEHYGMPADLADASVAHLDRRMADCLLALYRSGVTIAGDWAPGFTGIGAPGLAIIPENEFALDPASAHIGADRAGAEKVILPGVAHWWLLEDPALGAKTLESFWAAH